MSWTKRQFVIQALEAVGLASYVFDLTAEELQSAARQMDSLIAEWNAKGIRIGYPIPSSPEDTDLDTETQVPDRANSAIYMNLAVRLATSYGKPVPAEVKLAAYHGYQALLIHATTPPYNRRFPDTLPRGAGNKAWRSHRSNYFDEPADTVDAGGDDIIDI